jgi:hypothetical protein
MESPEMLSRASATLLQHPTAESPTPADIIAVAPAHVSHPSLYRAQFYPGSSFEWLAAVREDSVQCKWGVRAPGSGDWVFEAEFRPGTGVRARDFDVVAAALDLSPGSGLGEEKTSFFGRGAAGVETELLAEAFGASGVPAIAAGSRTALADSGLPVFTLADDHADRPAAGEPVLLVGHSLVAPEEGSHEDETMLPRLLPGVVTFTDSERGLIRTPAPAEMGMCGGAVVSQRTGLCLGIIEALIVGAPEGKEEFRDNTVFLRTPILRPVVARAAQRAAEASNNTKSSSKHGHSIGSSKAWEVVPHTPSG